MKIIAVTGGSGCGKTLFTNLLLERLQKKTAVLPLDNYYKDRPDQIEACYVFEENQGFDLKQVTICVLKITTKAIFCCTLNRSKGASHKLKVVVRKYASDPFSLFLPFSAE